MITQTSCFRASGATIAAIAVCAYAAPPAAAATFTSFTPVVNNGRLVPGTEKLFNSYNPPSINDAGLVVFRARSRGGGGQPASGIFTRDMLGLGSIQAIATRGGQVPAPNNTGATFNEFPSFPRIDSSSDRFAFRGQSQPVWEYQLPDGSESRAGTSGVFTTDATGDLITGVNQLGFLSEFDYFDVPGVADGTKFEQFPGAPSPTDGNTIVFKGNWTDPTSSEGKTGVYFRNVQAESGPSAVQKIADSNTEIPGSTLGTKFDATAPPSAAFGQAVFLGVDNEQNPMEGGIYRSLLSDPTVLKTVIALNTQFTTAGGSQEPLTRIGEALSFDGQYVAFWGALGDATRPITLTCPTEGNRARVEYCNQQYPDGFETRVPVKQGIFLANLATSKVHLIAETGAEFTDFLFWNFSGRAPGMGEGDVEDGLELARWRSTSFLAGDGAGLVFKALKNSGAEGLYAALSMDMPIETLLETGMLGNVLDPEAATLPIVSLGIERDGFRNGQLVLNASMADEESSWAGIYFTRVSPAPVPIPALLPGLMGMGIAALRKRWGDAQAEEHQ